MAIASHPNTWTYADVADWPEAEHGERYEIIEGVLVVSPSPIPLHQSLMIELTLIVGPFVKAGRLGRLFTAPVDVLLADNVLLIPDLVFVRQDRLHIVGPTLIAGPPDLVVEILSPSTRRRDLGKKLRLYAQFGIPEYWIVDPRARTLAVYVLIDRQYQLALQEDGIARSTVLPGLTIDVAALFAAAEI